MGEIDDEGLRLEGIHHAIEPIRRSIGDLAGRDVERHRQGQFVHNAQKMSMKSCFAIVERYDQAWKRCWPRRVGQPFPQTDDVDLLFQEGDLLPEGSSLLER